MTTRRVARPVRGGTFRGGAKHKRNLCSVTGRMDNNLGPQTEDIFERTPVRLADTFRFIEMRNSQIKPSCS